MPLFNRSSRQGLVIGFLYCAIVISSLVNAPRIASIQKITHEDEITHEDKMVVLSRHNTSLAMDPVYQVVEGHSIVPMKCSGEYPPFFMQQGDTSRWVCNNKGEKKVTKVMLKVFSAHCKNTMNSQHRGIMLDVGSNLGYYGLLAMAMGCESILFDLQPQCQQMINNAIVVNQFTSQGRVMPFGVSNEEASFRVPSAGCIGRFPASAIEKGMFDQGEILAHVYPLSKFIRNDQPILLMKVDTEGNERNVLEGAMTHFSRRIVRNAIVEVTPGQFWKNVNVTREQVAETFARIANYNYTMVSLDDYAVYKTPEAVYNFIMHATFVQSDVWFTTDYVDATDVEKIKL